MLYFMLDGLIFCKGDFCLVIFIYDNFKKQQLATRVTFGRSLLKQYSVLLDKQALICVTREIQRGCSGLKQGTVTGSDKLQITLCYIIKQRSQKGYYNTTNKNHHLNTFPATVLNVSTEWL